MSIFYELIKSWLCFDKDHHVLHAESIKLDIECMRKGLGSPMLSAHQYQIDKALKSK
jgi:hypothetical protein